MAFAMPPTAPAARHRMSLGWIRQAVIALTALALAVGTLGAAAEGSPVQAACGSFQSRVDAAASGSTITIPSGCTYKESVQISKPLTVNAYGATIDGENTRSTGLAIFGNDVTVNGLTVRRVKSDPHVGAVWSTNGASRFTFRDGVVKDSSTVCVSLNGGSDHRVLDSELTNCAKEGYFLNKVSGARFAGNDIHHNNPNLVWDTNQEAGGGKAMDSRNITFDNNVVRNNGGPGIWFDNNAVDVVVTNNRVYDNVTEGIFFEISNGARITGNAVWGNGFGNPRWGYGAGITISSSDRALVSGNTVAWNARGISVISQARQHSPHNDIVVRDNIIVQKAGAFVTGFYDDHGGSLYDSANRNSGSGNRYWVGVAEPSTDRFNWNGPISRLSGYNATRGEEGGRYLTLAERDAALAGARIPGPVVAPVPMFTFRAGYVTSAGSNPAKISWAKTTGASAYQLQLKRIGGSWVSVSLSSSKALSRDVLLKNQATYQARVRVKLASGAWSAWRYSAKVLMQRSAETSSAIGYTGTWKRVARSGAVGGYVRTSSTAGSTATFTFRGRAVAWLAPRGPSYGKAEVYVDGVLKKTVDLYRSSSQTRRVVFIWSWPSSGSHAVKIRVLGTAGRPKVDLDGFGVLN